MAYESDYGIYEHRDEEADPLAPSILKPTQEYYRSSSLYSYMERYVIQDIKDTFGLNIVEYLSLPTHIAEMLRDVGREHDMRKNAAENNAKKAAEKEAKALGEELGGLGSVYKG